MTNKHNIDDIPMMVPERDELASHGGKRRRGTSIDSASMGGGHRQTNGSLNGGVKFLLGLLLVGMLGSAGAGYFFYMQGQETLSTLNSAEQRIGQLESRVSMEDQASEQSSLGLLERVDFNFSEIDKLWAARNQNRSEISANKSSIGKQSETNTRIETVISTQAANVNTNTANLANIQTKLEAINNSLGRISALDRQLVTLGEDLKSVKASIPTQDTGLADRINTNEQDIESINIYRLQLNQTINSLKNSVNDLQQQAIPQI